MKQLYQNCGNEVYLVDSGCQIGGAVLAATGRPTAWVQQQNSRQGYWPLATVPMDIHNSAILYIWRWP